MALGASIAALNVLEGKVIGRCMKRHRHQEFIRFINVIDTRVAKGRCSRHQLARHPRLTFHFTLISAFWLNALEGLFALLSKRRLRRGIFRSLQEFKNAIHSFITDTNANPKPLLYGPKTPTRS